VNENNALVNEVGWVQQQNLGYWAARRHMLYYQAVYQFVAAIGYNAKSLVDIGSGGTDYITWFDWIESRAKLDYRISNASPGIAKIETDFFEWNPEKKYDVALCLQVLEHIPDAKGFCDKLKTVCNRLLISVPYKWSGKAEGHVQDPVDEEKVRSWMGIPPNTSQVVTEPFGESRYIAYYDLKEGPRFRLERGFVINAIREKVASK
jgi:hypothetical protein